LSYPNSLALVYLARGADENCLTKFDTFVQSYNRFAPGIDHRLFIIFKGFPTSDHLRAGVAAFASLDFSELHTSDATYDIGAYFDAARQIETDRICFLNTNSEIASHNWLAKLSNILDLNNVGLVGATGSFESLNQMDQRMPRFPNVHMRSNAFMLARTQFLVIVSGYSILTKMDAYFAESGMHSITRRVLQSGLSARVVGRDGRGYQPETWPRSGTFRQGKQSNLLVKDNHTRSFDRLPMTTKKEVSLKTWGSYINSGTLELLPGARM
jgi:hypothetical protein